MIATPGLLVATIITVVLVARVALYRATGRTCADFLIDYYERALDVLKGGAMAMRAAQREYRRWRKGEHEAV